MPSGNPANLVPFVKGGRHAGRAKGTPNATTRVLKTALLLAAEKSKNSKDRSLESYCTWLADERPELYVSLLGRLIPVQAKLNSDVRIDFDRIRLNSSMPLDEMIQNFELKLKSGYRPSHTIEHNDADDDDE